MISVAELVVDVDLGGQQFFVHRYQNQGSFQLGGYVETPTVISMFGVIQPATEEQLRQVPEGDRIQGTLAIWSPQQIFTTNKNGRAISHPPVLSLLVYFTTYYRGILPS